MDNFLLLLFVNISQTLSLPPGLLSSICYVESRHDIKAYRQFDGGSESVGICQVKLSTAQYLGFTGTVKELSYPVVNIYYAGKYLKNRISIYKGDVIKGISAYNSGSCRINKEGKIRNFQYVEKVLRRWQGRN